MLEGFDSEDEMSREDMIIQLVEWNEDKEELEEMDEQEIEDLYKEKYEAINDESVMFPNGRDYDAKAMVPCT